MSYVIVRTDHGRLEFVANYGGASFTTCIGKAKRFAFRDSAEREACPGNERVLPTEQFLMTPRNH